MKQQNYVAKSYLELMLNKLKIMGDPTSIYILLGN
jgi:hypothetical protein